MFRTSISSVAIVIFLTHRYHRLSCASRNFVQCGTINYLFRQKTAAKQINSGRQELKNCSTLWTVSFVSQNWCFTSEDRTYNLCVYSGAIWFLVNASVIFATSLRATACPMPTAGFRHICSERATQGLHSSIHVNQSENTLVCAVLISIHVGSVATIVSVGGQLRNCDWTRRKPALHNSMTERSTKMVLWYWTPNFLFSLLYERFWLAH